MSHKLGSTPVKKSCLSNENLFMGILVFCLQVFFLFLFVSVEAPGPRPGPVSGWQSGTTTNYIYFNISVSFAGNNLYPQQIEFLM